jgi:hypothetical protein
VSPREYRDQLMRRFLAFALALTVFMLAVPAAGTATQHDRVKVLCWNDGFPNESQPDPRSAPPRCNMFRDGADYIAAGAVFMRNLNWEHWGDASTVADGQYFQQMAPHPWMPITVRLKRPVEACGVTVYSKAVFHTPDYTTSFPLWTCG